MLKLIVTFAQNRDIEGKIHLEENGTLLAGPFPVCGRADDMAAERHGNPSRHPLLPFGDTPLGFYQVVGLLPSGAGTALPQKIFGSHNVVILKPTGGDAALADANGRFNTLIQGGKEGRGGRLLPTNGSLRLRDKDQKKLLRALAARENLDCVCEVRTGAVAGKPVEISLPYELGDPLSGPALHELRQFIMASMFVIGSSWNMIGQFNPPIFKYLASSSRFNQTLASEKWGHSKSMGDPSGGGGPWLMAGDGYGTNENSSGGSSGLNNAPTYHEDTGSGLSNAPTNNENSGSGLSNAPTNNDTDNSGSGAGSGSSGSGSSSNSTEEKGTGTGESTNPNENSGAGNATENTGTGNETEKNGTENPGTGNAAENTGTENTGNGTGTEKTETGTAAENATTGTSTEDNGTGKTATGGENSTTDNNTQTTGTENTGTGNAGTEKTDTGNATENTGTENTTTGNAAENTGTNNSETGSSGSALNQLKTLNGQGENADFDGRNNNSSANPDTSTVKPEASQNEPENTSPDENAPSNGGTTSQTTADESQNPPPSNAAPDDSNQNLNLVGSGSSALSSLAPMAAGAYLFSAFQNHQSQTVPNGSAAAPAMNNTAGGMNVSNPTNSASSASPADMSIPVVVNPALVSHQEVDQLNNEAGTPDQEARFMAQAAFQEWGSQSLDLLKVEAAKNWLESSAGRSEGVESAFAAADILGKLKSGKNDEAGAGAIDMAIGLIPLEGPGFGMAQAAHKIPGAVAQSAMVDFIGKINDFMGNDGSHEAAQAQYDEMMNQMTFGQKTIASFIGMKNEE